MRLAETLALPAAQEHHVFWPQMIMVDSQVYHDGLYEGYQVTKADGDLIRYLQGVIIPKPGERHEKFLESVRETEAKGKDGKPILKGDWGPNPVERVLLPYAEVADGMVLDVRGGTTWKVWTLGRPEYNDFSRQLMQGTDKGQYYRAVDNIPGVYVIVLTSDDRIVCGLKGKGKQFGKAGEPTIVVGAGGKGPLSEMAFAEIEEELGLTKGDVHFLDRNMKQVGWRDYVNADVPDHTRKLYERNVSPFMIFDKPDVNNPMAVFIARTELDWDRLYPILLKRNEKDEKRRAKHPDGAPDAWEVDDFFPLEAEPAKIREAAITAWKGSQAKVLKHFADFLEKRT
jgi:hypothetical protein